MKEKTPWEKGSNNPAQRETVATVFAGSRCAITGDPFTSILARRLGRRTVLKGMGLVATAPLLTLTPAVFWPEWAEAAEESLLGFPPVEGSAADKIILPPGYQAKVLLSWGQALFSGVPDLDTERLDILLSKFRLMSGNIGECHRVGRACHMA